MTAPRRLQLRRGNSTAVSTYTGAAGEVVIDTTNWTLRVHDGVTQGGYVVTANTTSLNANITQANLGLKGYVDLANTIQSQQISAANLGMKGYVDSVASQSIYANSNVKSYLTGGFDGNIIPSANAVYSLGNSTTWWKDLYLSENTLYIGGVPIGSSGGSLTFGGNVVGTSALPTYTGPVSANSISVGATTVGNITTLPTTSIDGDSGNITAGNISTTGELITGGDISTAGNISTTGGFTASDLSFKLSAAGAVIELGAENFKGSGYVPGQIYETGTDGPGTGLRVMVVRVQYGPGSYASLGSPADGDIVIIDSGSGYTNLGIVYVINTNPMGTNALLRVYTQVNPVTYGTITANTSVWSFDESGDTTVPGDVLLPDNTAIYNVDADTAVFTTNNISDATSIYLTDAGNAAVYASDSVVLETNSEGNSSQKWAFNNSGDIIFPDNTIQSTAFSNTAPIIITLSNNITAANAAIAFANSIQSQQLSAANVGIIGYIDLANSIQSQQITAANTGMKGYVDSLTYSNVQVATYLPTYSGNIAANISKAGYTWTFGTDGNLTLPAGGDILDSTGASVLGGGSSIPTVVTTGAVGVDGAAHAKVQFTVTSATAVTAVGVTVIGVTDSTKGTITLSGSPGTGAFDIVAVTNTFPGEYYILMPFATNASGTGYGAPISGEGTNPCLVRGTMITMADMSRVAVENITYHDDILVWDFDLGEFASAKPLLIKKTQTTVVSCLLTFSDHSELQIVGDSPKAHRIFNKEAGKFTYGSMPETPIGTTTFNDQGEEITLVSKEWIVGEVEFYNVITDYHMNLFANSILTSMRYNNLYPITDMKFVKDSRTLRTADDYPNVEERLYKGFRLAEQTHGVEEIETHIQWLLSFEVERETECV